MVDQLACGLNQHGCSDVGGFQAMERHVYQS